MVNNPDTESKIIVFAGNPNVGKSTLFNSLTGMNQHTGNWTGKTVNLAYGDVEVNGHSFTVVDIPGSYSLMAHSKEEEIARDYICFGKCDGVVVVCDATCLERNLNLVLQISELCSNMLVCINLCDEAKRKGIFVDEAKLEEYLGVKVVKTVGRRKSSVQILKKEFEKLVLPKSVSPQIVDYPKEIETAVGILALTLEKLTCDSQKSRFMALKIIEGATDFEAKINEYYKKAITYNGEYILAKERAFKFLETSGYDLNDIKDVTVGAINKASTEIYNKCVNFKGDRYAVFDRRLDKLFTGKLTGIPIMLAFLVFVFWVTIVGANYPSRWLSSLFDKIGNWLYLFFDFVNSPDWLTGITLDGAYNVLSTVVSVMLPPMAIFFPLFTLLEDSGYLPRIAYNLDRPFRKCDACGKQALTMCMGFGCNAAGVVGARIIDSPRERFLAILTNNFCPCNGRFPILIALASIFFVNNSLGGSLATSVILACFIVLSVIMTFIATKILSVTVLKGETSSFILELPPYRPPQLLKVLERSLTERILSVLGRAVVVAAPAGAVLWLLANVYAGDKSLLLHFADFLDPLGALMGLDGVILVGFILGLPANEIVLPIILMCYQASGSISDATSMNVISEVLVNNGWTTVTALNVMLFSMMHWPCSTTLLTVKRETGSIKWMIFSAIYPTLFGVVICMIVNFLFSFI